MRIADYVMPLAFLVFLAYLVTLAYHRQPAAVVQAGPLLEEVTPTPAGIVSCAELSLACEPPAEFCCRPGDDCEIRAAGEVFTCDGRRCGRALGWAAAACQGRVE